MVIVITVLCDLVKATVDWIDDNDNVANYQIISPIILLLSVVSVCVCVCVRACVRVRVHVCAYACMCPCGCVGTHVYACSLFSILLTQILMMVVIKSEKNQGIPSSGIQFYFWGALLVYAGIKLRTLILLSKDQVIDFMLLIRICCTCTC